MTFCYGLLRRTVSACSAGSFPVLASLVLLSAPLTHAQQVYKWTDEKGIVNYTTTPPSLRKSAVVNVAPAVAGQGSVMDYDESHYWRARSQREAASEMALDRMRRDTEGLRQARLQQDIAKADTAARQKSATQRAIDQCRSERRVDCESPAANNWPGGGGYTTPSLYPHPQGIIVNRTAVAPAPARPYFTVTPTFTPGYSIPQIYSNPR